MCSYSKVEECIRDPALVRELGVLIRAPGRCVAFDSAYVAVTTPSAAIPNRYYPTSVNNAYDAGPSARVTICSVAQSPSTRGCPHSPDNSLFLDVNEVRIMEGDDEHPDTVFPAIEQLTYYVGNDWIRDIYDFCKDDSSFSLLCNPNQNCHDGFGLMDFMGRYSFNSIGSPLQINVTTMDKLPEEMQTTKFCHCDSLNMTNCILPMNEQMTSCIGVCGSLCAISPNDDRTYSKSCYGAIDTVTSDTEVTGPDSTWADLDIFLASNLRVINWMPLNYILATLGAVVSLFLTVGFIVAAYRERRLDTSDSHTGTPHIGSYTSEAYGHSSTERLSFMDELMTKKFRLWAVFVSTDNQPKKIILMICCVIAICVFGFYNIEIETDPIKLWVSTSSTSYQERQHYGELFNPFYRIEQVIMVPKDGGTIYRSSILKEAIRIQNAAADVVYTSANDEEIVTLDDICWKATGTGCTVNSITQYFQNNMEHFEFYEKYGFEMAHFSNCLYSPTTSDVALCTDLKSVLDDGDSLPSTMSDCPCLSAFGSPMNLYNTYLGGFPDGAESNNTLFLDSVALVSSYLIYNYADDAKNDPAIKWEREYIKSMKNEAKSNTVFNVYFFAEISVQDEVDAESSNGMGPVALSYCLMIIYISLGINRIKFSRDFFITSKIVAGFCGVMCIVCGVASTIGLYMWFGVKLQLIIMEVVPFLSLAIGVDNIFLLIHAMSETEDRLRREKPALFVGLEQKPKAIEQLTTTIVSESLAYIGPSIFMASVAESVAFAFGSISAMPVVLWFAAMASCVVAVNFCFQMTLFLSILVLDKRRELSGKYDIIFKRSSAAPLASAGGLQTQQTAAPLVSLESKTPGPDEACRSVTPEDRTLTNYLDYCVDTYASALTIKPVKLIVLLAFLSWTLWSIYSIQSLDQGLPQKEAMPSDSYMIEYFDALDVYLATGVPVYFIVEAGYGRNPSTWTLNEEAVETIFCKSKDICDTYSIPNIMNALANTGDKAVTHISPGSSYSWMDDFWGFVNPDSECCRVNSDGAYIPIKSGNDTYATLRSEADTCLTTSVTVPPVPEDQYMSLFSMFATASAGSSCSYGGGSIYRGQFSIDNKPIPTVTASTQAVKLNNGGFGEEITAWSYMVTGTSNPTQQHYIDSYKQNLAAAEWISEKTGVDVWVYSLTYVYFEQYLTVIEDAYRLIGLALAAIFVVTMVYLGSIYYALAIALMATNLVVLVLGLMQPMEIMLNGLSIVNLIIAAGIAVEFSGHYVRFFAKAQGTGDERARAALRECADPSRLARV
ncbi:resistance-nodulation-cell division superfamily [Plasmopara halstedii]|uniref:Resistance-nodulation-cell division superfamily n=1 Tax=Plasmopara halstedii TaxID=4781 RepID=A0A0P1B3J3_PLAHL|nr:resistance-nodulation-cell division superfamily [Plasmopara halstedii]CEG48782.1 resistance-nodulation-cell division superfamily [Plasmopara halstedii]|eukprot:XP_024585151.1 resistance-nodulation-cell division superfamily [Plasmopara halstedii]